MPGKQLCYLNVGTKGCQQKSEDNFGGPVLPFAMESGDQTQVTRLWGKQLRPLSRQSGPMTFLLTFLLEVHDGLHHLLDKA